MGRRGEVAGAGAGGVFIMTVAIPAIIIVGTILEPLADGCAHGPGPLRDGRHHFARVRAGDAAIRLCLMISCAIAKVRLTYVIKDVMIMLMPMLGVLALSIMWPDLILFLPRMISPEFLKQSLFAQ